MSFGAVEDVIDTASWACEFRPGFVEFFSCCGDEVGVWVGGEWYEESELERLVFLAGVGGQE